MRFRGKCLDGPLKGKEVEGKLNIEIQVESVTQCAESPSKKQSIPWETIFICFFGVLLFNFVALPLVLPIKKTMNLHLPVRKFHLPVIN
jgi:hypothetical protein